MKKVLSFLLIATLLLGIFIIPSSAVGEGYFVVIGSGVNVRTGPGTQYTSVGQVSYGETFTSYSIEGSWVQMPSGNWIHTDYVVNYDGNIDNYQRKVSISSGTLSVRKGPTTAAPIVGSLSNNTNVEVLAETMTKVNGQYWAMISYNGGSGWVSASYLVNR